MVLLTHIQTTTTDYSEDDDSIDNEHRLDQQVIPLPLNGISFFPGLTYAQYNVSKIL